ADTLRLGRVERFEQPIRLARVDTRSGVAHLDADRARTLPRGDDGEPARALRERAHRLDSVDDQVDDHLLDLGARALDERQAFGERGLEQDVAAPQLVVRESEHLENRLAEVEAVAARRLALHEHAEPLDDLAGPPAFVGDSFKRALRPGEI